MCETSVESSTANRSRSWWFLRQRERGRYGWPAVVRPTRLIGRGWLKARGSLEHTQALIHASGEPAGRGLRRLAFHIGWVLGGAAGEGSLTLDRSRLDAYVEYMLGLEASQRLRPIRPPPRPASARSSSGRPLASASWQMCSGWPAVPSHGVPGTGLGLNMHGAEKRDGDEQRERYGRPPVR